MTSVPRTTLVLGGSRSGKSSAAESLLAGQARVTYVATGPVPDGSDPEWGRRVRLHREQRPSHWTTVETTALAATLREAEGAVLVDALGTWLTGLLDRVGAWEDRAGWREAHDGAVDDLVAAWRALAGPAVAVSDEVGSGVVPGTASGRLFRDLLGRLNTRVSLASDRAVLVVAGRALELSAPVVPLPAIAPVVVTEEPAP